MSAYRIVIAAAPQQYGDDAPRHLLTIGGRTFLTGDLQSTLNLVMAYPTWVGTVGAPVDVSDKVGP